MSPVATGRRDRRPSRWQSPGQFWDTALVTSREVKAVIAATRPVASMLAAQPASLSSGRITASHAAVPENGTIASVQTTSVRPP